MNHFNRIFFMIEFIYCCFLTFTQLSMIYYFQSPATLEIMIIKLIKLHKLLIMETTRTVSHNRTSGRTSYLPNIGTSNSISYAQRYQHFTKISNYNQLNQPEIWKQYEKLRNCLKELNEQVLYHMEKKAQTNLYSKETKISPTVQTTLTLLQEEKKGNETRLNIYQIQAASLETRISHLMNKKSYLEDITHDIQISEARIKEMAVENKDLKRRQKMVSKDLMTGATFLEQLVKQQEFLHYANKKYDKYEQIYKQTLSKIKEYSQKKDEYQKVFETRISQYQNQEDFITQEINLQKFEELQNHKNNLTKFDSIYKRNYLMKLKELEQLINSINRHDLLIQQTQGNIMNIRGQIDSISSIVTTTRKKHSTSMMQHPRRGSKSGRRSIMIDNSGDLKDNESNGEKNDNMGNGNDKNKL